MTDWALELSVEARKYLKPGQPSPAGLPVQTGSRGGRYYVPNRRKRARPVIEVQYNELGRIIAVVEVHEEFTED